MNRFILIISRTIGVVLTLCIFSGISIAGPDQYCGDTSMYGGTPTVVQPNVLIIVDDSGSMSGEIPGGIYDPGTTYPIVNQCSVGASSNQPCSTNLVYSSSYSRFLDAGLTVANVTTSCNGRNPQNLLQTTGQYNGRRLRTDGTCRTSGTSNYLLGNYINWLFGPGADKQKIAIARDVVTNLINSTSNIKMGLMRFHYPGGTGSASGAQGSEFLSVSASGSNYVTTIKDMDDIHTGTTTNREALVASVATLTDRGYTPLGESLLEAMRYFQGGQSAFGNTVGLSGSPLAYTSPTEYPCQKSYIIFVTDGMSTADDSTALDFVNTTYGRYDGGGCTNPPYTTCANDRDHSLAGAAKYLYEHDMRPDAAPGGLTGLQNVTTYTIGFGLSGADQDAIDLLKLTADSYHGHGNYYLAGSETALSTAFTNIISEIYSVNSSFVAPVVPVSPENRSYSGSRVYMGFFRPSAGKFWTGNLKKYGLGLYTSPTGTRYENSVLDAQGNLATYQYTTSDPQHDYRDNAVVPVGSQNGGFRNTALSYWSSTADRGEVDEGGVGELLMNRLTPRSIYTYLASSATTSIINTANEFKTTNTNLTETMLGFTAGDTASKDKLINFLHGQDAYDDNGNSNTTELRPWILGDILHSKPQVVSYNTYTYTHETDCSGVVVSSASPNNANNTMIFVGSNDGMLHAYRDCDGSETWAFIPPDLLPALQYLGPTGNAHTYYLDFSPLTYVFNSTKDGYINPANGDRVILLFGLRRGGGIDGSPTKGYYYALDVTDPLAPQFLWSISNSDIRKGATTTATTVFGELGEAWSDISFGKIKVGTVGTETKLVAFVGSGYDNCNEDARYGLTQTFTGSCVSIPTGETGATTSAGAVAPLNPKGRGLFVIDVATFDGNNIPQLTGTSGDKIWSYTNSDNPASMIFSIPGKIKPLDTNYDGYIDKLYAGDTGGGMWRFDIMSTSSALWTANRIFSSNVASDVGRKIFYDPSVMIQEDGTVRLFFGTGDREHPLNTAVVDRMYSFIDRGQTTGSNITESNMVDVTDDALQETTIQSTIDAILNNLRSSVKYGWYIKLNQDPGEKVLASSTVFSQAAIFTTYSPSAVPNTDPCVTGNLGTARAYFLNYLTGSAMINFDTTNDGTLSSNSYAHMFGASNYNLLRSDRVITLGTGIPSGTVVVISQTGQTSLVIGVGGSMTTMDMSGGGATIPLYWRQKMELQ